MPGRPYLSQDELLSGVITTKDLRESAKSWRRAAELSDSAENTRTYENNAIVLDGKAKWVEHGTEALARSAAGEEELLPCCVLASPSPA